MKVMIRIFSLVILTCLLLSSCRRGCLSVTKRHYNRGYYIAHSGSLKTKSKLPEGKESIVHYEALPLKTNTLAVNTGEPGLQEPCRSNVKNITSSSGKKGQQARNNPAEDARELLPFPAKKIHALKKMKISGTKDSDEDGLSLFGFIVLLVLILWLLGFLYGGIGPLIHLLLVVALVLLILWLLRII